MTCVPSFHLPLASAVDTGAIPPPASRPSRDVPWWPGIRFGAERDGDTIYVSGEIDRATAPELLRAMEPTNGHVAHTDLSAITFFGVAGTTALLTAVGRWGDAVAIERPSAVVVRTLWLTGDLAVVS